jgi:hypothetical protein
LLSGRLGVAQARGLSRSWSSRAYDAGDRVVALFDQRMRGRSTGIEVALGKYALVYTSRTG